MSAEYIFDREEERLRLRERLRKRQPLLIHGPAGVGKTLLLRSLLPEFPDILYVPDTATAQTVFRHVAAGLWRRESPRVLASCGQAGEEAIKSKSAVNLKGVVMEALHEGDYGLALDHLKRPSAGFAAVIREVLGWADTPVIAVARSAHMEDVGFLQTFYPQRSDRFEIRNFERGTAERFAREMVRRAGLSAENVSAFLERVLDFSQGNPGAIVAMVEMAKYPKYRSEDHIKVAPLYIDFRLNWKPARAR
jgi:DNA polymerase III delta prime subunit